MEFHSLAVGTSGPFDLKKQLMLHVSNTLYQKTLSRSQRGVAKMTSFSRSSGTNQYSNFARFKFFYDIRLNRSFNKFHAKFYFSLTNSI